MSIASPTTFELPAPAPVRVQPVVRAKEWELVITRRASKSAKVKVTAKTYPDAIEAALKLARTGQIKWNDENAIVEHEFNNCDPEAFPSLP